MKRHCSGTWNDKIGILVVDQKGMVVLAAGQLPSHLSVEGNGQMHARDFSPAVGRKVMRSIKDQKHIRYGVQNEVKKLCVDIHPFPLGPECAGAIVVFTDEFTSEEFFKEFEECKKENRLLEAIIDTSYDGFWISDATGTVIRINDAIKRIDGLEHEDEVVGKNVDELVRSGILQESVTRAVLKKKTRITTLQKMKRTGKEALVTATPLFNQGGMIDFVVANVRDITQLNELRREVEESRAISERYRLEISSYIMKELENANIVFRSKSMNDVIEMSLRVAKTDATVLIRGESGVGKELIAKLIHKFSSRALRPFIVLNCATLPEPLVESELFGYEKGAFTGASEGGKPGCIELSDGGTLFLDEIGELPQKVQVKLLRVLESGELMRVGSTRTKKIDVRILAATNADLDGLVQRKEFRKDLFFRLNVIPIYIPPLRERKEDIPVLVYFYLGKFCTKNNIKRTIGGDTLDALASYEFPGNVRELANIIERLVIMADHDCIMEKDLPDGVIGKRGHMPFGNLVQREQSLRDVMDYLESEIIRETMKKHTTQKEIAEALGISQPSVARKMKKYALY